MPFEVVEEYKNEVEYIQLKCDGEDVVFKW